MSVATPEPTDPASLAAFLKSSGQVGELHKKMDTYRSPVEVEQARNLLANMDTIKDDFEIQVALFYDQQLSGDQFFGTSASPAVREEVQARNTTLTDQKEALQHKLKKSRARAEQLNRDFEDEKAALPEPLTTRIIHVLDDYTLVVLMISYIFMMLATIFVYTSINGYSLSSILKAVGFAFFISILLFIIASIVL
jgi:hypothetical protein